MGIELAPEDPQLHAMAGSLYVALKQDSEAEAALQRALELDSDNFSALANLAKLRIQHRDFERARALVDRLMEIAGQRLSIMTLKRSEEHTSELKSLMRISYAVFCLKKKTNSTTIIQHNHKHQPANNVSRTSQH